MVDPTNLAPLYFGNDSTEDYVSPVLEIRRCEANRGLFATKDIAKGTCLFVTPPTLRVDVKVVLERHKGSDATLESVTEAVLVDRMLESPPNVKNSFQALAGGTNDKELSTMDTLLGKNDSDDADAVALSQVQCLQIIRKNAFGPDGLDSYEKVEQSGRIPWRLLGLYPLAAMLNHSCAPNCIRVFSGETMIVHAAKDIAAGEELVWSYLPPILPFQERRDRLLKVHDFECHCKRCELEASVWGQIKPLHSLDAATQGSLEPRPTKLHVQLAEKVFDKVKLSSELTRYLRVGLTTLYVRHFNNMLYSIDDSTRDSLLRMCTQLHLSLLECHNAGTEHLSILHLCYDLTKSPFWVEQLKQAHLTRYGPLSGDIENVRSVMKQTKILLRTPNGLDNVQYKFL